MRAFPINKNVHNRVWWKTLFPEPHLKSIKYVFTDMDECVRCEFTAIESLQMDEYVGLQLTLECMCREFYTIIVLGWNSIENGNVKFITFTI